MHAACPAKTLPKFIPPTLLVAGAPFDSDRHLFEPKWDGMRTLAFIEPGGYRLVNRRENDVTDHYPELECLKRLPPGTVLDGEIVVMNGERPDLERLLVREQAKAPLKVRAVARSMPATYVAFDQLFARFEPIMARYLADRRERLSRTVGAASSPRAVVSEGVIGDGKALFAAVAERGLEGIVAKRLDSRYSPGRRSGAWIKAKCRRLVQCVVIGFVPTAGRGFESLIVAAERGGVLTLAGAVSYGFDRPTRGRLTDALWLNLRPRPVIASKRKGVLWVEPMLFCSVSCLEWRPGREMREAVFRGLIPTR